VFFESLPLDLVIATPSSAGTTPHWNNAHAVRPYPEAGGRDGHQLPMLKYMCSRRINNHLIAVGF